MYLPLSRWTRVFGCEARKKKDSSGITVQRESFFVVWSSDFLKEKKIQFVSFEDWKKLDKFEIEQGQQKRKSRQKICEVQEMLDLIQSN